MPVEVPEAIMSNPVALKAYKDALRYTQGTYQRLKLMGFRSIDAKGVLSEALTSSYGADNGRKKSKTTRS